MPVSTNNIALDRPATARLNHAGSVAAMARIKQARPIQREPSSEFISKHDRPPPPGAENGKAKAESRAVAATEMHAEAGLMQLVIAVAGIYGSL